MNKSDKEFLLDMAGTLIIYIILALLMILLVGCGQSSGTGSKAAEIIGDTDSDDVSEEPVEETDFEKLTGTYNGKTPWSRLKLNDDKTFELIHVHKYSNNGLNVYHEKYTGIFDLIDGVLIMTKLASSCPGDSMQTIETEYITFDQVYNTNGSHFSYRLETTLENNGDGFHVASWWKANDSDLYQPVAPETFKGYACFMYRSVDLLNTQFQQLGQ